ncbi:MAG: B12-binding domain-containing radical SAM protein [Thermosphaera sp.]
MPRFLVVDALARAEGSRYSTFDVVGSGPRVVAGLLAEKYETLLKPYEEVYRNPSSYLDYKFVMVSAMTSDKVAAKKLVSKLRRKGFKGKIVLGGPVSSEGADILRLYREADYLIIGEAEIPLQKFVECIVEESCEISEVPALVYREKGQVVATGPHVHTPEELLNIVKPWTMVDKSHKPPSVFRIYVEVVRGCSNYHRPLLKNLGCLECFKCRVGSLAERLECPASIPPGCGFCSVPYLFGPPRSRNPVAVRREVEELIANGARRIVLSAPDFLDYYRVEKCEAGVLTDPCNPPANIEAIEEPLSQLASIREVEKGSVTISIENVKACLVNQEVASLLGKYLKGTTIHIGCETGDAEFNNRVLGKPISPGDVVKASKLLSENGLRPYVYLMYGLPFMDSRTYLKTLNLVDELAGTNVEKITLYKYIPLPQTSFSMRRLPLGFNKEIISLMKKRVEEYNYAMKKTLQGSTVEVFLLETERGVYGYPVKHGPVVFVKKGPKFSGKIDGCKARVLIKEVAPRYVKGVLLEIVECPGAD